MKQSDMLRHIADNIENGRSKSFGLFSTETQSLAYEGETADFLVKYFDGYEVAPQTHIVNGFEVPLPMSITPKVDEKYFFMSLGDDNLQCRHNWDDDYSDRKWLSRGLCFKTKEAAQENALAILGYDPKTTDVEDV